MSKNNNNDKTVFTFTENGFCLLVVKCGICHIIIFAVQFVGNNSQSLAKSLIMHNFALTQEFNRLNYIGIVDKAKNIIVCYTCLLLGCQIFVYIGNRVTRHLNTCSTPWRAACGCRVDTCGMVNKIRSKAGILDLTFS